MPSIFDNRVHFNGEVFGKYIETIPYTHMHELIKSSAIVVNNEVAALFNEQTGAFIAVVPYKGSIMDAEPVKYDGKTNIDTTEPSTFIAKRVVVGLAKGFTAKDFVYDITGGGLDESEVEAEQVGAWQDKQRERILYAMLEGISGISVIANKHTYNVTNIANSEGKTGYLDATTMNTGMQKACGDNKRRFALAIMHSVVATNLENLGLLTYIKYNDADGMQRDTSFATLNGRLVLVDDDVPTTIDETTATYAKTSDVALVEGKTYYTRSGSSPNYVYTAVAEPDVSDIGSYYEKTYEGDTLYKTFVFGTGSIEYTPCGAKVPYELSRDAAKNGGETTLYVRQRDCFAPKGFSFEGEARLQSLSPSFEELRDPQNWAIAYSANGDTIDDKSIALAIIVSKG